MNNFTKDFKLIKYNNISTNINVLTTKYLYNFVVPKYNVLKSMCTEWMLSKLKLPEQISLTVEWTVESTDNGNDSIKLKYQLPKNSKKY